MRAFIFGASAGIGRALARELASRGHSLVLIARARRDLEAEAENLRLRHGVHVDVIAADATTPHGVTVALRGVAERTPIDVLLFPVGMANDRDDGFLAAEDASALVNANLTSIMVAVNSLLPAMLAAHSGTIVGFGSVAAARGRNVNVVYAAAKRGLESYFESLRHACVGKGVVVQFYRLGYVATQMSYGRHLPFPIVQPETVARAVVRNIGREIGRIHIPRFWRAVTLIVVLLPWMIYRRLRF